MRFFSYSLIALAVTTAVQANTTTDDENRVLVSGTRSEQTDLIAPVHLRVISAEEIQQMGAGSVIDVLAAQAGLQINDSIGHRGRGTVISMRGFGDNSANNVLVMVNGRKLNNPSLAAPDLSSIQVQNIKRIEIVYGSAGTLYGDQATAGVIHIFTFNDDTSGFAEITRGSDDLERYRAAYHLSTEGGFSVAFSGDKKIADNYRQNNEQYSENLEGRISYNGQTFGVYAELQGITDNLRFPGSVTAFDLDYDRTVSYSVNDFGDRSTQNANAGAFLTLAEKWIISLDGNARDEENEGFFWGNFTTSLQSTSWQPKIAGTFKLDAGDMRLVAGVDVDQSEYETNYGFGLSQYEQNTNDAYLNVNVPVHKQVMLSAGLRHSEYEFQQFSFGPNIDQDTTVYNVGATFNLSTQTRVYLRLDESFRWPNADENGFTNPANPILKPQFARSAEIGLEQTISEFQWQISFFDISMQDEIFYDPIADGPFGPGTGANVNLDDSQRRGALLSGKWQLSKDTWFSLDYSYTDASLESGSFAGNDVPWVAKHRSNARAFHRFNDVVSLYLDAQYTGERLLAGDNANIGETLGGYVVYNAGLRFDGKNLYSVIRVNNATGKEYSGLAGGQAPYEYFYPAALRQFEVTLGYQF